MDWTDCWMTSRVGPRPGVASFSSRVAVHCGCWACNFWMADCAALAQSSNCRLDAAVSSPCSSSSSPLRGLPKCWERRPTVRPLLLLGLKFRLALIENGCAHGLQLLGRRQLVGDVAQQPVQVFGAGRDVRQMEWPGGPARVLRQPVVRPVLVVESIFLAAPVKTIWPSLAAPVLATRQCRREQARSATAQSRWSEADWVTTGAITGLRGMNWAEPCCRHYRALELI